MDFRNFGFNSPLITILEDMLDIPEEQEKSKNNPSRAYVRDAKAMAATPADVMEYPTSYVFIADMPGISPSEIKVHVEDENVLVVCGERKREKEKDEKEGVKYVRMERRVGKFMRKFQLPDNANMDKISAVCQDGVLRVTVEKLPPPEPKKSKTIESNWSGLRQPLDVLAFSTIWEQNSRNLPSFLLVSPLFTGLSLVFASFSPLFYFDLGCGSLGYSVSSIKLTS
ncbi:hypothetical protein Gotur_017339 [Gossypium turneri]